MDRVFQHLHWVLGWINAWLPPKSMPIDPPSTGVWFTWGPNAVWADGVPAPATFWEVCGHAADLVWTGAPVPLDAHDYESVMVPVWPFIGAWQVIVVLAMRSVWDRRGAIRRADARPGHLFYAGREEFQAGIVAAVLSLPFFAIWRLERALWESSILFGPRVRSSFVEVYTGAQWMMLMQVVLLHWLLVWFVYKWVLRRGLRAGRVIPVESARCPSCGYESSAARCPECGADRADPKSIRPRVFIPWIENRPWVRWVFRTRTALIAIVVLFFSPVWMPAIRVGISALFP